MSVNLNYVVMRELKNVEELLVALDESKGVNQEHDCCRGYILLRDIGAVALKPTSIPGVWILIEIFRSKIDPIDRLPYDVKVVICPNEILNIKIDRFRESLECWQFTPLRCSSFEEIENRYNSLRVYDMGLHDTLEIKDGDDFFVLRVPGGWIYYYMRADGTVSTFVPFDHSEADAFKKF